MKYFLSGALVLLITLQISAQMNFFEGDWKSTVSKAGKENKYIFMDAYTSWCGPCKAMSKNIFPLKEVGDFYNAGFINVKFDMEKGEGPQLAQTYGVNLYPTYLFFDPQGNLVHRAVGYMEAQAFIDAGRNALDPAKQLTALTNRYQAGERNSDFLLKYAYACYESSNGLHEQVAQEYLKVKKDWKDEQTRRLIMDMVSHADNAAFNYVASNRELFKDLYDDEAIDGFLARGIAQTLAEEAAEKGSLDEKRVNELFKAYVPKNAALASARFLIDYYASIEDWEKYAGAAEKYVETNPEITSNELNTLAWAFFVYIDEGAELAKAIEWSKRSVEKDPSYYNLDTYAALYYKTGNKKKAKKYAKQAIAKAKKDGLDYKETEELLNRINGK